MVITAYVFNVVISYKEPTQMVIVCWGNMSTPLSLLRQLRPSLRHAPWTILKCFWAINHK